MKKRLLKALSLPIAVFIGLPLVITLGVIQWIITGQTEHSPDARITKYMEYLSSDN